MKKQEYKVSFEEVSGENELKGIRALMSQRMIALTIGYQARMS